MLVVEVVVLTTDIKDKEPLCLEQEMGLLVLLLVLVQRLILGVVAEVVVFLLMLAVMVAQVL
jgi:hypothetical protein